MAESTLSRTLHNLLVGLRKAEGTDDAALLTRFAAYRDETAFELIVFRHGPMVRGTCRRLLRHEQDAEDAFQATFLALARKAGSVRGSLGGWLYRVASHAALKARARVALRRAGPITGEVAAEDEPAESREQCRALDEEVSGLPGWLRLPVVLCYLQGKSNTEAAAELGCPRGTVDSRLTEARRRLRARLARRGFAPAAGGVALEQLLAPSAELSAAAVRPVVRAAVAFAHDPAASAAVPASSAALAQGVLNVMYLNQLKWAACALLVLCTLGTGGVAAFRAADDPPAKDAKPPPKDAPAPTAKREQPARPAAKAAARTPDARAIRARLLTPVTIDKPIENLPLREALAFFSEKYDVAIRIDPVPFLRVNPNAEPQRLYTDQVSLDRAAGLPLGEVLRRLLAPLKVGTPDGHDPLMRPTFVARGTEVVIVPAFVSSTHTAGGRQALLNPEFIAEQVLGDFVSVDVQDQPLADVLRDLADRTGANVVLDVRQKEKGKTPVTLTLQQVRLLRALQVLAEMADLKPVALDNVYFVTDPRSADRLEKAERPAGAPAPTPAATKEKGADGGPTQPPKP